MDAQRLRETQMLYPREKMDQDAEHNQRPAEPERNARRARQRQMLGQGNLA